MAHTQKTMCRICEALCGLEVTVADDGTVLEVRPDRAHPVSKGYACVKGTSLGALHHDPDRLDTPMKRVGDDFEPISWADAMDEIGTRVRELRSRHGDRSVALYTGNPTFFSFQAILWSSAFLEALGSPNHFASHSIDVNTKFFVAQRMYGLPTVHPVPDLDRLELLVVLGSNPAVSQMSVINAPDALGRLRAIEARGGRVVLVDPRRTETAAKVGEHVPIRPGTDAHLLAAMAHVVLHEDAGDPARRVDLAAARAVARNVDAFAGAVADWTPERVEPVTGIPADRIRELARAFRRTERAALYCSTGVNMGPFGSLAAWLLQGLNLVCGKTDRAGGLLVPFGPFDVLALARMIGAGEEGADRTLVGGWPKVAGAFPVGALADEITVDHPERIRALFVSAGNPAHSVPGGALPTALDELDLLVCIDLYRNETGAHADYLLPAADMLERSDYPVSWANLQPTPHVQWTPAVVPPRAERRVEWEIWQDLAVACGAPRLGATVLHLPARWNRLLGSLPAPLGERWGERARLTPDRLLALLLRWGRRTTMGELRAHPEGVALPPTEPGSFLGRRVPTPDGLVDLAPRELLLDLPRLAVAARDAASPPEGTLALIGRRERRSHNSWMHNNPGITQPAANQALVHPDDAAALGLTDGGRVAVEGNGTSIELPVRITTDVAPGVVSVPHGWGHDGGGLSRAGALGGGNVNAVIEGGQAWMEPVSGQSIMLAQRVRLRAVETTDVRRRGRDVRPAGLSPGLR